MSFDDLITCNHHGKQHIEHFYYPRNLPCAPLSLPSLLTGNYFVTFIIVDQFCCSSNKINEIIQCVLVTYFCIKLCHKLSSLKQQTSIISQFLQVRNLSLHGSILCSGSHKAKIKVLAKGSSHLGSGSSSKHWLLAESISFSHFPHGLLHL